MLSQRINERPLAERLRKVAFVGAGTEVTDPRDQGEKPIIADIAAGMDPAGVAPYHRGLGVRGKAMARGAAMMAGGTITGGVIMPIVVMGIAGAIRGRPGLRGSARGGWEGMKHPVMELVHARNFTKMMDEAVDNGSFLLNRERLEALRYIARKNPVAHGFGTRMDALIPELGEEALKTGVRVQVPKAARPHFAEAAAGARHHYGHAKAIAWLRAGLGAGFSGLSFAHGQTAQQKFDELYPPSNRKAGRNAGRKRS